MQQPRARTHSSASQGSQGSQGDAAAQADKVALLQGSTKSSAMFVISEEDHTLGNALKHVASQDPNVKMAAYSIPHPLENKMRIQLETNNGESAVSALSKSLNILQEQIKMTRSLVEKA